MSALNDPAPTPLHDLRVVEISDRIAGAYCGKLLADAGADVIKVEPADGDPLRRFTASGSVPPGDEDSPLFAYLNAGKRSVTSISDELLTGADIVIVTATRSAAAERGIDPQRLLEQAPRLIIVTISDFGWTGPWAERPATEFTLQADSGLTGFRGDPAGPPISIGGDLGEYMGGVWAAYGALATHRGVVNGGRGGHLDMSMLEAITLMQSGEWLHSQLLKSAARPALRRSAVDRTRQGRLRRHQHGHGAAVAGLRRDGGLSGVHRGAPAAIPDRAMGLPRLDPGAYRPVDARAHRGRDRRTRAAVQVAAGRAGKRRHDPRDGSPAGSAACTWTTRRGSGNRVRRG